MESGGDFHGDQTPPPHPTPGQGMQPLGTKFGPPESINKSSTTDNECIVREQDRFLPITNVSRIMRKILPPQAKISDDAKRTIQECVSEYISFITSEANDRCKREKRKTVMAEDILWAMSQLGFDNYIEPLTIYLYRYREFDGGERGFVWGDQPLVNSAVDVTNMLGIDDFEPVFDMGHHHNGLFGPVTNGGFMEDPPNAGPSKPIADVAGFEPYAKSKE